MGKLRETFKVKEDSSIMKYITEIEKYGEDIEEKVSELFPVIIPKDRAIPGNLMSACEKILIASINTLKVINGETEQQKEFAIKLTTFPNRRNFLGGFAIYNERRILNNYYGEEIYLVSFTDYYSWVEERNFDFKQLVMCIAPPAYEIITGVLDDDNYRKYYSLDSRSCSIMNYSGEYGYKLAKGEIDKKDGEKRSKGWLSNSNARLLNAGFSNALGWNFNYFRNEDDGHYEYERKLQAGMQLEMAIYIVEELKSKIIFNDYDGKYDVVKGEHKTLLEVMLDNNKTEVSEYIISNYSIDIIDLWEALIDDINVKDKINWKCLIEAGLLCVLTYDLNADNQYSDVVRNINSYVFNATRNNLFFEDMKSFDEQACNWTARLTELANNLITSNSINIRDVINEIGKDFVGEGSSLWIDSKIVEACVIQYVINHNLDSKFNDWSIKDYANTAITKGMNFQEMLEYERYNKKQLDVEKLKLIKLNVIGKCYSNLKEDYMLKIVEYSEHDDIDLFCSYVILGLKEGIPKEYIKTNAIETVELYLKSI